MSLTIFYFNFSRLEDSELVKDPQLRRENKVCCTNLFETCYYRSLPVIIVELKLCYSEEK